MEFAKGTIVRHNRQGTRYESDGNGGWTVLGDGDYYPPGSPFTWALRDEEAFSKDFTVVTQLHLKVGDKVRLTGPDWAYYAGFQPGDVVDVDRLNDGAAWNNEVGSLTDDDGTPYVGGYEIELVEDEEDAEPEAREVTLDGVVADIKRLGDILVAFGVEPLDARHIVLGQIEKRVMCL